MHTPYKTTRLPDTKHYTYLDVQGRPVVTIKNVGELTEKHIQDFQLEFVLPRCACTNGQIRSRKRFRGTSLRIVKFP